MPAWGEANKPRMLSELAFLDSTLADGRPFITGDGFTVADITALCAVDFMRVTRVAVPDDLTSLRRWHAHVSARPSAVA